MEKLEIYKLDSNAVGVGKLNDRPCLCDGVIEGEEIEILEKVSFSKFDSVISYNLIKSSEARVKPLCKYFFECGGCSLQHADIQYQKKFKINRVKNFLKHIANIEVEKIEYIDSEKQYEYRNKIVFAVNDYQLGMYKKNSKEFLKIDKCMLINSEMNGLYDIVARWVRINKIDINHVALRQIGNIFVIVLIGDKKPEIKRLLHDLKSTKYNIEIVFNKNDAKKDLITDRLEIMYGSNPIFEYNDLKFPISANSFLQVNNEICEKLYNSVTNLVDNDVVLNAYSGAGLLSAILSKKAKFVYGIEIVKNAHDNANDLIKNNNICNVKNFCGKSEEIVPRIMKEISQATLVVDPPRKGVDEKLLILINDTNKIKKVIYVSCDPNSLAKDLRVLKNYKIQEVKIFNMFPQSEHVETLVCLIRK